MLEVGDDVKEFHLEPDLAEDKQGAVDAVPEVILDGGDGVPGGAGVVLCGRRWVVVTGLKKCST